MDSAFTTTSNKTKASDPTFAGALSFFRRRFTKQTEGADVVVWGVPFDSAVTNRPGARFGPQAIRRASAILDNDRQYPFMKTLFEQMEIVDYGDCDIDYSNLSGVAKNLESEAEKILASKSEPYLLSLGGDHFITYPLLRAHAKKHGELALVQFDAHQDTWNSRGETRGENINHGTMIRQAVEEKLISAAHSIQVGIRTVADSDCGIEILDSLSTEEMSANQIAQKIKQRTEGKKVYVTFDIDCLDPAFAPGTGTPVAGGMSTIKALGILNGLSELNIVGSDVVEVAPAYDQADITALAGATIAMYMLGLRERSGR